jgi:hypothetical protein
MRFAIITGFLAWAAVSAGSAPAQNQNPPAAPAVERTILAGTKLPDLTAQQVSFCPLSVTILANAASHIAAGSNAIFYQLGGSIEIMTAGATKTLATGEAMFVAGGHEVFMKAVGDGPSRSLHFCAGPGRGFRFAYRDRAGRCHRAVPHACSNPRPQAGDLRGSI